MTLTLEETSLILSLVALIVTGLGFFASLKFYREGMESQQRVRGLLDRVEAKVEVLRRDVGGMVKSVWDYAFSPPKEEVQAQARQAQDREGAPGADADNPIQLLGKELQENSPPGTTLVTLFALRELHFTVLSTEEGRIFFQFGQEYAFNLFDGPGPRLVYYGHFHQLKPVEVVERVRLLIGRLHDIRRRVSQAPEDPRRDLLLKLLGAVEITVLVPGGAEADRVHARIMEFQAEDWKVKVTVVTPDDLEQELSQERRNMEP